MDNIKEMIIGDGDERVFTAEYVGRLVGGFSDPAHSVQMIYERNKDQFLEGETAVRQVMFGGQRFLSSRYGGERGKSEERIIGGQRRSVRVFSRVGLKKICNIAEQSRIRKRPRGMEAELAARRHNTVVSLHHDRGSEGIGELRSKEVRKGR